MEKTELRVVDVRCFRGDPIQLNDLHVAACPKVLTRRNTNIKAPEEETVEGLGDAVDDFFQVRGYRLASVEKDGPAAMGPDLNQLHSLSRRGYLLNSL